ncbi:SDR family NAD(P)-dependent oxidoreductase [Streptomyces sp. NPDC006544]|uniref:SDR family NAD(P)-dependent oxidoreductase n=1 Tax=Streptomyces sp. NPDC006544 TaxID=3154583 RepID=UPI0033BF93B1
MAFPALRELLDAAPGAVVSAMFPPTAFTSRGRAAQRTAVTDTRVAQPALGLAGSAAHLLLGTLGVRPDCVAGHSYGELTALWAAGVWDARSLLRLSARRAEAIVAAAGTDPGAMAAVAAAPEAVREIAERSGCVVANHNAPRQCVISGPSDAVSAAVAGLREAGLSAQPIPVACAFHSEVVAGAATDLAEELARTALADATVPVWSNTTAGPYPASAEDVRRLVARQVAEPVRFVEQVENMYAAGVRTFVEAGPGRVLSGLVGRILQGRPHTVVPLDVPGEHGLVRLVTALAELTAAGVPVAPEALFRGRTSRLPDRAPRRPGWLVDGHLIRTADGRPIPGGLRPAERVRVPAAGGTGTADRMAGPAAGLASGPASAGGLAAAGGPDAATDWRNGLPVPAGNGAAAAGNLHPAHWASPSALADPAAVTPMATGPAPTPLAERPGGHQVPAVDGSRAAVAHPWPTTAESTGGPQMFHTTSAGATAGPEPVDRPSSERANGRPVQAAGGGPAGAQDPAPAVGGFRPGAGDGPAAVMLEYLRGSRELVQAQRDVLLGYLGSAAGAAAGPWAGAEPGAPVAGRLPAFTDQVPLLPDWAPVVAGHDHGHNNGHNNGNGNGRVLAAPAHTSTAPVPASGAGWPGASWPAGQEVPGGGTPARAPRAEAVPAGAPSGGARPGHVPTDPASAPPGASVRSSEDVMDVIVEIVHTRTGYPRDMLDPELDLEADLSVDSIKRVEIIGALADRIGLPRDPDGSPESAIEELSRIKTLRGIVDWVTAHSAPPAATTPAAPPAEGTAPATSAAAGPAAAAVSRLRVDRVPLPASPGDPTTLRGLRIGVVGDGLTDGDGQAVAPALTAALLAHGADVTPLHAPEAGFDAVLDLSALRPGTAPALPEAFPAVRRTLAGGVQRLLLVSANGTVPGAGLHGFARSAALEFPGRLVRAVDVHPKEDPERIAAQLVTELTCTGPEGPASAEDTGPASVGYTAQGVRITRRPVPAALAPADGRPPPLGPDAVVLLTGGARGITARTALALARATGCHVELMGRTPEPPASSEEFEEFGHATDRAALRAALIATGLRTPAEIEAAASRILAGREVRATLSALGEVAASVRYHCADVTDGAAVRAVVARVRERHGRLDGIVHGAGTLRDGLLLDKQPAAFDAVFTTKVTGARHLAVAAAEHGTVPPPRFLALFGSVAGVYGNRGQCDYAAANDALDCLAHTWAESFPGRVLSVDWGPWAAEAGGMVSPELARAYARRGIPLIEPEAGAAAFLAELSHGTDVQVVLMAGGGEERGEHG